MQVGEWCAHLKLRGELRAKEHLITVNVIDKLEELGVQFCLIAESLLHVLHELHQQDGFLAQVRRLVQ